nr:MAG TPA: hypothetical protein [Caudoviricetes sp.]
MLSIYYVNFNVYYAHKLTKSQIMKRRIKKHE